MEHKQGQLAVTLDGKPFTLFFDYTFVSILQGLTGGSFEEVAQTEPMRTIPLITLAALQSGDDVNELPTGLTERMVSRWLSAIPAESNTEILESYKTAMGFIGAVFNAVAQTASVVAKPKNTKVAIA